MFRSLLLLILLGSFLSCNNNPTPPAPATPATPTASSAPGQTPAVGAKTARGKNPEYGIVPGKSIGRLSAPFHPDNLLAVYGKRYVKTTEVDLGSGLVVPGYLLFPGTDNQVYVAPADSEEADGYATFLIYDPGAWHIAGTNIHVGSTLQEVYYANGGPFTMADGSREAAGEVTDWRGGRLAGATLKIGDPERGLPISSEKEQHEISSDDERLKGFKPQVTEMYLYLKTE